MNCLRCDTALSGDRLMPEGGLTVVIHGNYGSRVFDPVGNESDGHLEAYLCDSCLTAAATAGRVNQVRTQRPRPVVTVTRYVAD